MKHLGYRMHEKGEVVQIGPRIDVVGCRPQIEVVLESGIDLPAAFGNLQAWADYMAFQAACRVGCLYLGILPSRGEAVEYRIDSRPLWHE